MKIVVIGNAAQSYAAMISRDGGSEVRVVTDPVVEWASTLAAATDADRVILTDLPHGDDARWIDLTALAGDRLILSRPLHFDRIFSAAKKAIQVGDVGVPKAVHIAWSFSSQAIGPESPRIVAFATELADVALWLLDDSLSTIHALICAVDGPPLMTVNLQTRSGFLAILEATINSPGLPRFRDVSLHASEGSIYHRTLNDDVMWTSNGAEILSYSDDALEREVAAVTSNHVDQDARLALGPAVTQNLAVARALARSLANRQPVRIGEDLGSAK